MAARKGIKYLWAPLRGLLRKLPERDTLLVLSVVVGVLCGLAAVVLKGAIHAIHYGWTRLLPGANWPYLVLPGVGMLMSYLIVRYVVRDNIGHGVTKVLVAISMMSLIDENCKLALDQLPKLAGAQVHSTVMLGEVDRKTFHKLGIGLTCDPVHKPQIQE